MPWVKLKRWMDCYLKRRRREWKLQCALHSLGLSAQTGVLAGGGSDEHGGFTPAEEMSDDERVAAMARAGFMVTTQRTEA